MANNATNVTTGKPAVTGAIYWAPEGTTLPTSVLTTLPAGFVGLGYVSEDGLTNDNSPDCDSIKAWGGDTVLSLWKERPDSFGFTLIEANNADVLKVVYGSSNVAVDGTTGEKTIKAKSDALPVGSWVIDMIYSDNTPKRIVIPRGRVSEVGTITYKDDEAVGYALTVTDLPDSTGVYHYEYIGTAPEQN